MVKSKRGEEGTKRRPHFLFFFGKLLSFEKNCYYFRGVVALIIG
jgi:hypothetical protein